MTNGATGGVLINLGDLSKPSDLPHREGIRGQSEHIAKPLANGGVSPKLSAARDQVLPASLLSRCYAAPPDIDI
jgi:hypothetical protein